MTFDTYEIVKNCGSKKEDMRIALNAVIEEYKPIFEDHSGKVRMVALDTSPAGIPGYLYPSNSRIIKVYGLKLSAAAAKSLQNS